jgi:DNA-binding transcriptional regulator YdaS (Cro superfamily)
MKLMDYLYSKHLSIRSFAIEIGISPSHLINVVNGRNIVSDRIAYLVKEKTQGQVSKEEIQKKESKHVV